MSNIGIRERHTGTGLLRLRCLLCSWTSGTFETVEGCDLAMTAHAEAVHGLTPGDSRPA